MFFCSYVFKKNTCSSVLMSSKKYMFFCSHVVKKYMFFRSHVFKKIHVLLFFHLVFFQICSRNLSLRHLHARQG